MTQSPKKLGYMPDICPCCKQSCTYLICLDHGSVDTLKAISFFIRSKGINVVHPRKEMEKIGLLTSNQVGNLPKLKKHGLIASVRGERGNYLLTRKGADFLKGSVIPRYAIISKVEKHQLGYFAPEILTCAINDFNADGEYWSGIDYEIIEGNIIHNEQQKLI